MKELNQVQKERVDMVLDLDFTFTRAFMVYANGNPMVVLMVQDKELDTELDITLNLSKDQADFVLNGMKLERNHK